MGIYFYVEKEFLIKLTQLVVSIFTFVFVPVSMSMDSSLVIKDDSGKIFGVIKENLTKKSLLLLQKGQEPIEIGSCSTKIISKKVSSNDSLLAQISVSNCGATTDHSTKVELVKNNNVKVLAIYSGQPYINLTWTNSTNLLVERSKLSKNEIYKELRNYSSISVLIKEQKQAVGVTNIKAFTFANINYGVTGLAAGIPKEVLYRIAGWSQQASGLYRTNWGAWYGRSPYGDNPEERNMINYGMQYYFEKHESNK